MKTLGIIPARYASSRFPGKPLAVLGGKSMIRRVYERAGQADLLSRIVVATDDERIFDHVQDFGGEALMTSPEHRSGTDRCAEVASQLSDYEIVVNIQGDEPFIDPVQIDQLVRLFEREETQVATLARQIRDEDSLFNPNVVKVVLTADGRALYFSRSTIPHLRSLPREQWLTTGVFYQHIGLYGFQRSTLLAVTQLPPGKYEQWESLEQLRWLEHGFRIVVGLTNRQTIGVDTPEDIQRAEQYLKEKSG